MSVVVYKEGGFYDVKPQTWLTNNKAVFYHLLPKKHALEDQISSYRLDLSVKLSNFCTTLFYFDYQHSDYYCPTNIYVKASRFDLCHQALKKALLTRAFCPLASYRQRRHWWTLRNHCVLTLSQVSFLRQSILAHIQINFTGDSDDEEVVSTRKNPNLPKEIRGRAQWIEKAQEVDSHYKVYVKAEALPIEYINGHWYWINYDKGFW